MKKTLLLLVALLGMATSAVAQSMTEMATCDEDNPSVVLKSPPIRMVMIQGDVNGDGTVNITDAILLINALTNNTTPPNGDVNRDGEINITDAIKLINMILNGTNNTYPEIEYALNSIYQSMRTYGWSTNNSVQHHSFGVTAHILAAEVMGDDMMMGASGSGWYWQEAMYNVKSRYSSPYWRSHDLWFTYYTLIANANYLLDALNSTSATTNEINYIKGQAYAIRAYSYFMLCQWFARTYKGHENEPGVPLFNGTVFNGSTGAQRSTVAEVYTQINNDISQAISLLNGKAQQRPEHMSYAVVQGLRSRVALVKEDWATAYNAAVAAISASGKTILEVNDFAGLNDVTKGNVMWGARIPSNEVTMYASFWAHMRSDMAYGQRAPKLLSKWLYNKISTTDARRNWWKANDTGVGGDAMLQNKFNVVEGTQWDGDYIWMRIEEMYLNAAEAACRRGQTTNAMNYLNQLMAKRDPNYSCSKSGTSLGALTTDVTGSLLEEILIQRRIELWGEDSRVLTIKRLRQGMQRDTEYGWPAKLILPEKALYDPESYNYVMTIPSTEFISNPNMNPNFMPLGDQTPLSDVSGSGQNLSFKTASSSMTTAKTNFTYTVEMTRASTKGEYSTYVDVINVDEGLNVTSLVSFADGESSASVTINCNPLALGQTYHGTLALSPYDESCHSGGSHISTHTFTINCQNGDPTGQEISFERASVSTSTNNDYQGVYVTLTRARTDNEYTAKINISGDTETATINSPYIYFAEDKSQVNFWVNFNDMEFGKTYTCTLTLSPEDVATGGAITSMQITVSRENWTHLGWGNYESGLFGQSVEVYFLHVQGTNKYKMQEPFDYGYDILFTINDNNEVYIMPQQCYNSSNYGIISMKGYANQDNSGFAGMFDPNTRTATLEMRYFCDAGNFPTQEESFTLP